MGRLVNKHLLRVLVLVSAARDFSAHQQQDQQSNDEGYASGDEYIAR